MLLYSYGFTWKKFRYLFKVNIPVGEALSLSLACYSARMDLLGKKQGFFFEVNIGSPPLPLSCTCCFKTV